MGGVLDGLSAVTGLAKPRQADGRVRSWRRIAVAVALLIALNVAIFAAPVNYRALGMFAYVGVFLLCFVANATTFIPVPYIPVVAHVAATVQLVPLLVLAAALGSVLGESVSYVVGRAGTGIVEEHAFWRRIETWIARPWRAGVVLFLLAVPLNPLFDVAGLAAGALGLRYRVFFASVFLARVVRMSVIAWLGTIWV